MDAGPPVGPRSFSSNLVPKEGSVPLNQSLGTLRTVQRCTVRVECSTLRFHVFFRIRAFIYCFLMLFYLFLLTSLLSSPLIPLISTPHLTLSLLPPPHFFLYGFLTSSHTPFSPLLHTHSSFTTHTHPSPLTLIFRHSLRPLRTHKDSRR